MYNISNGNMSVIVDGAMHKKIAEDYYRNEIAGIVNDNYRNLSEGEREDLAQSAFIRLSLGLNQPNMRQVVKDAYRADSAYYGNPAPAGA